MRLPLTGHWMSETDKSSVPGYSCERSDAAYLYVAPCEGAPIADPGSSAALSLTVLPSDDAPPERYQREAEPLFHLICSSSISRLSVSAFQETRVRSHTILRYLQMPALNLCRRKKGRQWPFFPTHPNLRLLRNFHLFHFLLRQIGLPTQHP